MTPAQRLLRAAAAVGRPHIHPRRRSGLENLGRPGLRCCEPSGFRSDASIGESQTAHNSVNACVVSSRGFGVAAGFSVFKLEVTE